MHATTTYYHYHDNYSYYYCYYHDNYDILPYSTTPEPWRRKPPLPPLKSGIGLANTRCNAMHDNATRNTRHHASDMLCDANHNNGAQGRRTV